MPRDAASLYPSVHLAASRTFHSISCPLPLTFVADLRTSPNRMRSRVGGSRESGAIDTRGTGQFFKRPRPPPRSTLSFVCTGIRHRRRGDYGIKKKEKKKREPGRDCVTRPEDRFVRGDLERRSRIKCGYVLRASTKVR